MDIEKIRGDFPIFKKNIAYLDNASTTQKPLQVIEKEIEYYTEYCSNVHRGIYEISEKATEEYENARKNVATLINSKTEEIIFTKGTTEGINLVMHGMAWQGGDEIITTEMEHHSNIVPWLHLREKGVKVKFVPITSNGTIEPEEFERAISKKTKLVTVCHASNVLGTLNNLEKVGKIAKDNKSLFLVDAAQSVPHVNVDVKKIGCDFLAFSGHKMLGPTGIGALYGRKEILEKISPFQFGGDMIKTVTQENAAWNDLPYRFEAGTPNISGAICFGAAIGYLKTLGFEQIKSHEQSITRYAMQKLSGLNGVKIYGPEAEKRIGVISFSVDGIHPHDLGSILDEEKICIRAGHHCAQPLMKSLKVPALARASFYIYNKKEEVDKLVEGIEKAKGIFKV